MTNAADVAREAGVSRATVSYVLNHRMDARISDATRERVTEVARRLGYSGSSAARALRAGRGDIVLVLTPPWGALEGPVGTMLQTMGEQVYAHGLMTVRFESTQWVGQLDRLLSRISAACVVTLAPLEGHDARVLEAAGVPEVPVRFTGGEVEGRATGIRQRDLVAAQLDHLAERGYAEVGYVMTGDPASDPFARARWEAFGELCRERGLRERGVVAGGGGDAVASTLREWVHEVDGPLGVATWNDVSGLEVLSAASKIGAEVPGSVGIVGCDDAAFAAVAHPPLSTVRYDLEAEADGIAQRVLEATGRAGEPAGPGPVFVSAIARGSTALRGHGVTREPSEGVPGPAVARRSP